MPPPTNKFKRFRRGNSGVEPNKKQTLPRSRSDPSVTGRRHVLASKARNLTTQTQPSQPSGGANSVSCSGILTSQVTIAEDAPHTSRTTQNAPSNEIELILSDEHNYSTADGTYSRSLFGNMTVDQRAGMWKHPFSLLAVLLARGSKSLTREQYERIKLVSKPRVCDGVEHEYPNFSNMDRSTFRYVEDFLCVQYSIASLPRKVDKSANETHPRQNDDIGIVFPRQWAKYDIRDPLFYSMVYGTN